MLSLPQLAETAIPEFSSLRQYFGLICQLAGQIGRDRLCQSGIGLAPGRNCSLQTTRTGFREPDRAAAQIRFNNRNLDQSVFFQCAKIARQRRLLETSALGQRPKGVIRHGCDMRHQSELGHRKPEVAQVAIEKLGDTPRCKPAVAAGTRCHQRLGIGPKCLSRLSWRHHRCMYIHHL